MVFQWLWVSRVLTACSSAPRLPARPQLTVNGKWEGPHVFVVRLRDDHGGLMPGVRVADNGPKQGLLGVDNGQCWFDHVRVPRDALLDRFSQVRRHAACPAAWRRRSCRPAGRQARGRGKQAAELVLWAWHGVPPRLPSAELLQPLPSIMLRPHACLRPAGGRLWALPLLH